MLGKFFKKNQEASKPELPPHPKSTTPRNHQQKGKNRRTRQQEVNTWDISQFAVEPQTGKSRFHDFDLPETLMRGIHEQGFEYCTPIQEEVLAATLSGRDALGRAQTGTGKTAAFLISTIKQLMDTPSPDKRYVGEPRSLIIAPTRELAMQIAKDAKALTKYCGLNVTAIVGGMDYSKQQQHLHEDYIDILVATPGRLLDFYEKRDLFLDLVEIMVIDEADRMLDMGFIPQVRRVIRATPRRGDRQTLLFSATFTPEVMDLTRQWTYQCITVEIEPENVATDTVEQIVYLVSDMEKYRVLRNLLRTEDCERVIVFANRRDQTRRLTEKLQRDRISADMLSGEVPQKKRVRTLEDFRSGKIKVLVATDVAGRGIHIDAVSHVVNYTLPEESDDYVHRIGRTGRAGASGIAITLAGEADSFLLPALETMLGKKLPCSQPPAELMGG